MKILSLEFEHVNNISQRVRINFEDPAFDQGIFLITGKTGSGKSTILDAITLALYGRTARFSQLSDTFNPVMTKGASKIESRVTFSEGGKIYESAWWQTRAYGKSDGRLSSPKATIYCDGSALTRTISEWKSKVEEITGMNYDRFSRIVVLSQGEFSRFLKADRNEKSKILEALTGTEIYSDISRKTYAIHKEAEEECRRIKDEIASIHVLSESEREERKRLLFENEKSASITNEKGLLMREALATKEKALEAMRLGNTVRDDRNLFEEKKGELETKKRELESFHIYASSMEETLSRAEEKDRERKEKEAELSRLVTDLNKLKKEHSGLASDIETAEKQLSNAHLQIKDYEDYLQEHKEDISIPAVLESLKLLEKSRDAKKAALKAKEAELTNLEIETERERKEKTRLEKKIAGTKEREENLRKDLASLEKEIESILDGSTELSLSEKKVRLGSESVAIENVENLSAARSALSPGKPCPLCGSVEHPYMTPGVLSDILLRKSRLGEEIMRIENSLSLYRKAKEERDRISSSLDTIIHDKDILSLRLINTLNGIKERENRIAAMLKSIDSSKDEMKEAEDEILSLLSPYSVKDVSALIERYRYYTSTEKKLRTLGEEKIRAEEALSHNRQAQEELERKIRETEDKFGKENEALSSIKKERSAIFSGGVQEMKAKLKSEKKKIQRAMEDKNDEINSLQSRISGLEGRIAALKEDIDKVRARENPYLEMDVTEEEIKENDRAREDALRTIGSVGKELQRDEEENRRVEDKRKKLEKAEENEIRWNRINELIGSSNGDSFKRFAQSFTFRELLKEANKRLARFSDRYILTEGERDLEFSVIDSEDGNEIRPASSLSGGESFIVSLSLALGLSSFSSRGVHSDSFFLDEGFGTLDRDYLDKAVDTLLTLREEGKTIGIISHVEALGERLGVKIKVDSGHITLPNDI